MSSTTNEEQVKILIEKMSRMTLILGLSMQPGESLDQTRAREGEAKKPSIFKRWLENADKAQAEQIQAFNSSLPKIFSDKQNFSDFRYAMQKFIKMNLQTGKFVVGNSEYLKKFLMAPENEKIAEFLSANIDRLNDANNSIEKYAVDNNIRILPQANKTTLQARQKAEAHLQEARNKLTKELESWNPGRAENLRDLYKAKTKFKKEMSFRNAIEKLDLNTLDYLIKNGYKVEDHHYIQAFRKKNLSVLLLLAKNNLSDFAKYLQHNTKLRLELSSKILYELQEKITEFIFEAKENRGDKDQKSMNDQSSDLLLMLDLQLKLDKFHQEAVENENKIRIEMEKQKVLEKDQKPLTFSQEPKLENADPKKEKQDNDSINKPR